MVATILAFVVLENFFAFPVFADSSGVVLRALFPNPVGSDTYEWVLVENTSAQTVDTGAFRIRDTVGTVHTASIGAALASGELRLLSATQSAVTLNNTGDTVQLLNNGTVVQESANYGSVTEGDVWLWTDEEWTAVPESEFWDRLAEKNWSGLETEAPDEKEVNDGSEEMAALVDESATSDIPIASPTPKNIPQNYRSPQLEYSRPPPAAAANKPQLHLPEYDFDAEKARFVVWKKQALLGTLSLCLGGIWWLLISWKLVWDWWQSL